MESSNGGVVDAHKKRMLIRVYPRYVRLRQGSEIRYSLKLTRPISKGKAVTIHVCVIMNKCGVSVSPQQLVVTASDWKLAREVIVTSDVHSELRTIQIHHKIHETYDELYNASTVVPSVFVSVLQKEATFLFVMGCGLDGRLGSNDEENADAPTPFACKWLHPVQIACGKAHSAIIDVYSNLYCFGVGAHGQLGQGDSNLEASKLPLRVPTVGVATILHVACGSDHTMCVTTEGKAFAWGDNTSGQLGLGFASPKPRGVPTRVEKLTNVRALACGGRQSFVVLLDNNVLACGSNIAGQLGLGDRKDRAVFERIPFFRKLYAAPSTASSGGTYTGTIGSSSGTGAASTSRTATSTATGDLELACGLYHAVALCGTRVYTWGNGDDGRLGHGSFDTMLVPTLVAALSDVAVCAIACGGGHSGAIAATGDVYLWGANQHGQLGTGTLRSRRVPTKIRSLADKRVTQLAFGEWHSLALCADGALYAWGFGEEGQLGLPFDDDAMQRPSRVVLTPTLVHALSGTGATTVRCGGSHTFVVSMLEARRPQLARMQRCTSQTEAARPQSAGTTGRTVVMLDDADCKASVRALTSHVRVASAPAVTVQSRPSSSQSSQPAESKKKTPPTSAATTCKKRLDRASGAAVTDEPATRMPLDFAWRERPLSSRAAVRNALRLEVRALADARATLSPLAAPAVGRAQSARCATASPRLRRLHEQVLRDTKAGAALLACRSAVCAADVRASICAAVETATRAVCDTETRGLAMPTRCMVGDDDDDTTSDKAVASQSLVEMLYELRGAASTESDESDSDATSESAANDDDGDMVEDDVIIYNSRRACTELEREIVWQLSSP